MTIEKANPAFSTSRRHFLFNQVPRAVIAGVTIVAALEQTFNATIANAVSHTLLGVNIIDNPDAPQPAFGKMSVPWGPFQPASPAEDIRGALGKYGRLITSLGRRVDVDPLEYFENWANLYRDNPDIINMGICPGVKFALWGPWIQGSGGISVADIYFNEFERKAVGAWASLALAPVAGMDFDPPFTPRQFHLLNTALQDKLIPYSLNTTSDPNGQPWMRPAFAVDFGVNGETVSGAVEVAEYDRGTGMEFRSFPIDFKYRLNEADPNDQGDWINQGQWSFNRRTGMIWSGLQVNTDYSQVSSMYGHQRVAVDLDVAGLVVGTKVLV